MNQELPSAQELFLANGDLLTLELSDEEVLHTVNGRIEAAKSFWNKNLDLENVQKMNKKYWMNETLDDSRMYPHNVRYKDNRIFQSIETIIPQVLAQLPQPIVTPAHDTDASRELARNIEQSLEALYYSLDLEERLGMATRHLLSGMRYAVLKYRFDPNIGILRPNGERVGRFAVDTVNPQAVVFDAGARRGSLPFMAEYVTATGDELLEKFPEKKQEIEEQIKRDRKSSNEIITYPEMWFEYIQKGEKKCGVCWKYGDILLGKSKNPYYNYEEPERNYFDRPRFPYVVLNYLSMGRYIVDDTSLTEQAANPQDILNKRGRQIVENADSANGGKVINSLMVNQDDASRLVGDPNETLMAQGDPNKAMARVTPPMLPDYVFADKLDARNEIDNIFGTHAPLKGEGSTAPTLGQEMISQQQDKTRIQTIAKALERGAKELYEGLVQMMCVFWDEPTQIAYTGVDGKSIHMEFDNSKIEPGVQIAVKAGSTLPKDRVTNMNIAMKLAPVLDPLSLAEALDKPDPKEFAKRLIYYKYAMDRYVTEILGENSATNMDHKAMEDIKAIVAQSPVLAPENPSKSYIGTFQTFMESDAFKALPVESQTGIREFAMQVLENGRRGLMIQTQQNEAMPLPAGQPGGQSPQSPEISSQPALPETPGIGAAAGFGA